MMAAALLLDVFLLKSEGFGSVENEHFHANIGRNGFAGGLRYENHQADRKRHRPDGWLLSKNAQQRVRDPKFIESVEACKQLAHWPFVQGKGRGIDQRRGKEGRKSTGEHAGGGSLHGHSAPPDTHEKQRKIAGRSDGESLSDHEIDLKWLDDGSKQNGDSTHKYRAPFEHFHAFFCGRSRADHAAIHIVGEGASHGNEQS